MSINKITSQSVQPVDVRDQDFRHGGKDSPVTFPTADPVNDHASTINSDTPPASEQSAFDRSSAA